MWFPAWSTKPAGSVPVTREAEREVELQKEMRQPDAEDGISSPPSSRQPGSRRITDSGTPPDVTPARRSPSFSSSRPSTPTNETTRLEPSSSTSDEGSEGTDGQTFPARQREYHCSYVPLL